MEPPYVLHRRAAGTVSISANSGGFRFQAQPPPTGQEGMMSETARWAKVVKDSGATLD